MSYVVIEGECPHCAHPWQLKVEEEDLEKYRKGMLVTRAFPYLNASQRELLMTGICPKCWDIIFKEDD